MGHSTHASTSFPQLLGWLPRTILLVQLGAFLASLGNGGNYGSQVMAMPAVVERQVNPTACALVGQELEALSVREPDAAPTVPAQLAFDCLQTVPNKAEPAQKLVKSLQAYIQWQSTLPWLKDPPSTYRLPATDIPAGLEQISRNVTNGRYASEYDFQLDILQLFASAHDGHFNYRGDVFKAFGFGNILASDIVSVSRDGREMPRLYHGNMLSTNAQLPPAITRINGQEAAAFIQDLNLKFSGFQDPDSQWNSMFPNYASPNAALTVSGSIAFQGARVTLTYDNGRERSEESFAIVRIGANFSEVRTGEDFYQRFCNPEAAAEGEDGESQAPPPDATQDDETETQPDVTAGLEIDPSQTSAPQGSAFLPGYPEPTIRDSGSNSTSGYFFDEPEYSDVAVLSVSSFAPAGDVGAVEYLTDFQETIETFLAQCREQEKTRLVIDLSANGGGFVVAGFELFAQLFPDVPRFQANNMRLADSLAAIAQGVDDLPAQFQPSTDLERQALFQLASSAIVGNFIPGEVVTPSEQDFPSLQSILGPVQLKGEAFTAYQQAPLNRTSAEFNLTGVGSRSDPPPAVFDPEDIVILTDGTCGSTCTIFAYFAILGLNVKTAVMGGRPQTGPMQAVAGVEGAQVFFFNDIQADAAALYALGSPEQREALANSDIGELAKGYAVQRAADPLLAGAVNGKNAFMAGDASTPLQFLWQPASCRFFYTPEMVTNAEAAWKMTVDATWEDPGLCVEGSRAESNSTEEVDPQFRLTGSIGGEIDTAGEGSAGGGGGGSDTADESQSEESAGVSLGTVRSGSITLWIGVLGCVIFSIY